MNKKLLLAGAFAAAGFICLTAFGGQTREQQEAEIAAAVTGKLDELRATLETTCNERIATESQTRFNAWLLAEAAKPSKPGVAKPKPVTSKPKPGTGKPSVDPLPQPTTPPPPSKPTQDKFNQGQDQSKPTQDKFNQGQDKSKPTQDKFKQGQGGN
ncbi:MAG: hypothetical protein ACOYNO_07360 [Saprospiraceae bacterium]